MIKLLKNNSGQTMILAIVALGGTILGATTIAGLLTVYQLRQSIDSRSSAQAIFAADAGIEIGLYQYFQSSTAPALVFSNGASTSVKCYDGRLVPMVEVACSDPLTTIIRAIGRAGTTNRAFEIRLGP